MNHNIIISRPLINHNILHNIYIYTGYIVIIGSSAYHPIPVAGPTAKVPHVGIAHR